ncbi:leucine transcriptional activator [Escherichia coli]|uniref:Leucine transcriptional activator n=1 Tax=Escherichia coli TaxID=562 RepID=A0A2X3JQR9_ECOLX|nr:leucine transcriptional activator [Escherichia coli]
MTVELSMPEVQTDHSETAELSKPQLRMVDLNLLTVFDAVMQEQNITRAAHVWVCRNLRSVTLLHA